MQSTRHVLRRATVPRLRQVRFLSAKPGTQKEDVAMPKKDATTAGGWWQSLAARFGAPADSSSAASTAAANATANANAASTKKQPVSESAAKPQDTGSAPAGPFTALVNVVKLLKKELLDDAASASAPYQPPVDRRRQADRKGRRDQRVIEEDEVATGLVMHKDSAWQSQWNNFKDNNAVVNGLFNLRLKFEESDNIFVRGFRSVADSVGEKVGGVFEEGDMAQTMAEISKVDPSFNKDSFVAYCEQTVIPVVLEAYIHGDKATLREWCSDACFSFLEQRINERVSQGLTFDSKILDIRGTELLVAKMMDDNPMLVMSFVAQQVNCVRDRTGAITEGGEDRIEKCYYVFALRRNQGELDPLLAWQVMEIGVQASMETW